MTKHSFKMFKYYLAFIIGCFFAFTNIILADENNFLSEDFETYYSSTLKNKIVNIYFVDNMNIPNNASNIYDVSLNQDESIKSWLVPNAIPEAYDLYVGSLSTIYFPADSSNFFNGYYNVEDVIISNVNTANVTNMDQMFYDCYNMKNLDIRTFNTTNVTSNSYMFSYTNLKSITISDTFNLELPSGTWVNQNDGNKYIYYNYYIDGVSTFVKAIYFLGVKDGVLYVSNSPVNNVDVDEDNELSWTMEEGESIESVAYGYSISKVVVGGPGDIISPLNMAEMFMYLTDLESLDLTYLDTSNVIDMDSAFYYMRGLETLDLSNFDTRNVDFSYGMFLYSTVKTIKVGSNWNLDFSYGLWKNSSDEEFYYDEIPGYVADTYTRKEFYWSINYDAETLYISSNPITGSVYGSFDYLDIENSDYWQELNDQTVIKHVVVGTSSSDIVTPISMYSWFAYLYYVESYDLTYLNTGNVTDMSYIFYGNTSLTSLDLSNFNTSNVTTMESMFASCTELETLNISSFNTSKVEDMTYMFSGCTSLGALSLNNFNTKKVENMTRMFYNTNIESLDLSSFNTESAVYFENMFSERLKSVTVGETWTIWFDSGQWKNSTGVVFDYDEIPAGVADTYTRLVLLWGINPTNKTLYISTNYVAVPEGGYTGTLNLDGSFENALSPWRQYYYLIEHVVVGLSENDIVRPVYTTSWFDSLAYAETFDLTYLDTSNVINMSKMFYDCYSVTSLDLSNFNTSKVTNMNGMFYDCYELENVVLSSFNTSNVRTVTEMFTYTSSLKNLDIGNFNLSKAVLKDDFLYDSGIETITVNKTFNGILLAEGTYINTSNDQMYEYNEIPYNEIPDNTIVTLKRCLLYYSINNGVLRINNYEMTDGIHGSVNGTGDSSPWTDYYDDITSIIVGSEGHVIKPLYTAYWFYYLSNVTSIDLTYLDTSLVLDMSSMFEGCESLQTLNLTNFNTSEVVYFENMFKDCINLVNLNVSNFNTEGAYDMSRMFFNCKSLTSIDISNFSIFGASYTYDMFYGCDNIKNLDIRHFDFSNVNDSETMFGNMINLEQLKLSDLSRLNNRYADTMFDGCTKLILVLNEYVDYTGTSIRLYNSDGSNKSGYIKTGDYVRTSDNINVKIAVLGDVNKDGEVDVSDASMIRAHSSQRINISDYLITTAADVNHDNDVDISDSSKIIAHIVKGVELK